MGRDEDDLFSEKLTRQGENGKILEVTPRFSSLATWELKENLGLFSLFFVFVLFV